jgi:excisionase family DNA binding protein
MWAAIRGALLKTKGQTVTPGDATTEPADRRSSREHLLTVPQIAQRLSVSSATVYNLVSRGALGHVRVSNAVRVRQADLEAIARDFVGPRPSPQKWPSLGRLGTRNRVLFLPSSFVHALHQQPEDHHC